MKRDYYEILGVGRQATPQEIKTAYRKLAIQYHPDRNPDQPQAEERFKQAAEAYSVLSDPETRGRYDRFGHSAATGGGFSGFDPEVFSDFSDILGDFFGFGDIFGGTRGSARSAGKRGADLRYDLRIPFEEAVFGTKTKVKIPRQEVCSGCSGNGADPRHEPVACDTCGGHGQVRYQQGFFTISRTCSQCHGGGRLVKHFCPECQGKGRISRERILEMHIPAGVDDDSRLRISGEGESGLRGGPPGDLYVVLSVETHPFFTRQNEDIQCEISINFSQAALGADISVPTLKGKAKLRIPPGTQSGSAFRLPGRGTVNLNGGSKGDQLVIVKVVTPARLSKEQRQLLERLAEVTPAEKEEKENLFEKVREIFG